MNYDSSSDEFDFWSSADEDTSHFYINPDTNEPMVPDDRPDHPDDDPSDRPEPQPKVYVAIF